MLEHKEARRWCLFFLVVLPTVDQESQDLEVSGPWLLANYDELLRRQVTVQQKSFSVFTF